MNLSLNLDLVSPDKSYQKSSKAKGGTLLVTKGKFIFIGDNAYKAGNVGEPINGDVDAVEIIHFRRKFLALW